MGMNTSENGRSKRAEVSVLICHPSSDVREEVKARFVDAEPLVYPTIYEAGCPEEARERLFFAPDLILSSPDLADSVRNGGKTSSVIPLVILADPTDDRSIEEWLDDDVVDLIKTDDVGLASLPAVVHRAQHVQGLIKARRIAEEKLLRIMGRTDLTPLTPDQMEPTQAVLYALYDGVACGVGIHRESDGRCIDCNQEAVRIYGARDKTDLLTRHPAELSPPEQPNGERSWKLAKEHIALAWEKGSHQFEWTSLRFDGTEYVSETFLTSIDLGHQRVLMAVFVDITARKRAEEALRRNEEKYRRLVEGLENEYFFYVHDSKGLLTYVSPSVSQVLGYGPEDLQGKSYRQFLTDNPINRRAEEFDWDALSGGTPPVHEAEVRHADGSARLIEVLEVPVKDENGEVNSAEGIIRDVSKQRRAESQIRQLNAELEDRVKSRTALLEEVVGDLKNEVVERRQVESQLRASQDQLRNLSTYLESAREEDRKRIAREIHDELGQNLTALRLDIALLGRRFGDSGQQALEKLKAMTSVVDETILSVRRICSELRPALLDNLGLSAAMEWLLDDMENRSAVKGNMVFSPEDIEVSPEVGTAVFRVFQEAVTNVMRHAQANLIEVSLEASDGVLELLLEDDGIGIPEEQAENPSSFGIVGMHERIRSIGGRIVITSVPDKGTRIKVTVPLVGEGHRL